MNTLRAVLVALLLTGCGGSEDSKGKSGEFRLPPPGTATEATARHNSAFARSLRLDDPRDFENARRGFIAAIDGGRITGEGGAVPWDIGRFSFLDAPSPPSVNPSLWRQAQLNAIHGLFEVTDGVYQVRGYDLSVMTLIRGRTGWIVVDPMLTEETARAALELAQEKLGKRPVSAVVFTHSHGDHFGGIEGVLPEGLAIDIVAPDGFFEAAISENVLAGNHMTRRATFQFGTTLEAGPSGLVDSGIGKTLSRGSIGLIEPTVLVKETGERLSIDGVDFEFIMAPDTEAPAEFMFYLPQFKAFCAAELATGSMHNVLTLRGAQVRDALSWSLYLDEALQRFSADAQVVFASHNWPTWGNADVVRYLENQRDAYRYLHDQTLRLANQGYTLHEIPDLLGEPAFMREDFSVRGYYGTMNHNAKATFQRYFGWWDGNPANLNPHPPTETAERYVHMAGGSAAMLDNAREAFDEGDYRWTATVMNHLVFAEPKNKAAKMLLASAYEQLGFQSESAIWRNYYLVAAKELREGVLKSGARPPNAAFVQAVSTELYFKALAVRLVPSKAGRDVVVNFVLTDTGERIGVKVRDGVASHAPNGGFPNPQATATMKRADFDDVTIGRGTFQSKLATGAIRVNGDVGAFLRFLGAHEQYDENFNVVTP